MPLLCFSNQLLRHAKNNSLFVDSREGERSVGQQLLPPIALFSVCFTSPLSFTILAVLYQLFGMLLAQPNLHLCINAAKMYVL
jgi:hypothetical protein